MHPVRKLGKNSCFASKEKAKAAGKPGAKVIQNLNARVRIRVKICVKPLATDLTNRSRCAVARMEIISDQIRVRDAKQMLRGD